MREPHAFCVNFTQPGQGGPTTLGMREQVRAGLDRLTRQRFIQNLQTGLATPLFAVEVSGDGEQVRLHRLYARFLGCSPRPDKPVTLPLGSHLANLLSEFTNIKRLAHYRIHGERKDTRQA